MNQSEFQEFLEALVKLLAHPFLPKDFVTLSYREDGFIFSVGDRAVEIGRTGQFSGSGTNVGDGKTWEVKRVKPRLRKTAKQ